MTALFLSVTCPGCGVRSDKVPAHLAGRTVRCPRCSRSFTVEAPPPPPAATVFEDDAPAATTPEGVGPLPTEAEVAAPLPTAPEREAQRPSQRPTVPPSVTVRAVEWRTGDVFLELYEVLGVLGKGGMGTVYKVRHRGWDLDLAAKVPLPSVLEAAGGAKLFEDEAQTWVNLGLHPHTVTCYYVRPIERLPVVFAEFVNGGSLYDWIKESKLTTLDAILDVAIQFAWGLHYAHEQGLVHLDVKPANVMLTADGLAKVTDFGLARARTGGLVAGPMSGGAGGGQTLTVEGALGGTPAYLSPEHAEGGTLTRRSDLWAWALSVLEMFQGLRTWDHGIAAAEALEEYIKGGPSGGLPEMPGAVVDLLRKCFRENPEERPHTLSDAAQVLRGVYQTAAAKPYPRRAPRIGHGNPDSLNNRAVSLLDLGGEAEAAALWKRALEAQPHHVEATYNQSLSGWISGRWDDDEVLRRMGEARATHEAVPRAHHLLGRLNLELGHPDRAIQSMDTARKLGLPEVELDRDLGLAALAAAEGGDPARRLEHAQRAAACFKRAVDAGSQETVDPVGYALALERAGEGEKARHFYQLAAAQNRDLPPQLGPAVNKFLPGWRPTGFLKGLTTTATAIAITPDGTTVLAGSGREVRIWDVHGVPIRTLVSEDVTTLRCLAVTPDGRFLIWAGEGAPIEVWDLLSGRKVRSWQAQTGFTTALAVAPDGRHALAGGSDRQVRLWDMATGQCLREMKGHEQEVTSVAIGRTRAVSGSRDKTARVWDLADGRCLGVLGEHKARVAAVALSEEHARVVTAGDEDDRIVRDWGLNSHELVREYYGHVQPITSLLLASGGMLFSGCLDRTVRAWDLERGRLFAVARLEAGVRALAMAKDGMLWAAQGAAVAALPALEREGVPRFALARPVSAVEVERRVESFEERVEEARRALKKGDFGRAVELTRTARSIPGHERAEAAVALWDEICAQLPRRALQSSWEEASLEGHTDQVLSVAVSPDGERAASAGMDQSVRLWATRERTSLTTMTGHTGAVTSVAFLPDGQRVVSGGWDKAVRLWDVAAGRLLRTLGGHDEYVSGVAVAPDGSRIVSGSWDQTVKLWGFAGGARSSVFSGHTSNVSAVAFGADGRYVVSGSWDATVRAWDVASGDCVCLLEGHEGNVTAVAVSPTGRQVASGGLDATVRVWDLRSRRARVLSGHTGEVTAVAFSPDGRYLASAGKDDTVRLWDVQKGECVRTLPHAWPVLCLAWTPAGNALLSGSGDRKLRIWHLDWEPETRGSAAWDEKARPFLETFVSVRLKPETVRGPATAAFSDTEVDALIADLRHRGFGGLRRETVVGKLKDLTSTTEAPPSFWDEVRRSAPKVAKVARSADAAVRRVPWARLAGRAAVVAVALGLFVVGVKSWMKPKAELRLVPYMAKTVKKEVDLINFASFPDSCEGPYETYRDKARAGIVSAPELKCLASFKSRGTVTDYLAEAPLSDPDPLRGVRVFRNAVSVMVGLGDAAVEPLCAALADTRAEARRVAAVSLATMASPSATACLRASLGQDIPLVRVSAASVIRILLANGQIETAEGWTLVNDLLRDPDPAIRMEALKVLAMFTPDMAEAAATPLLQDPDPAVARAAQEALENIKAVRKIDLLRAGS